MKILRVLTSHEHLGDTGKPTGFWLEEFATPYYIFRDAGAEVTRASPKGGMPPIDPASEDESAESESTRRYLQDRELRARLNDRVPLRDLDSGDYDAVFFPGGHGPLWDLANDPDAARLIASFYNGGKPVAAVCHRPAVFRNVRNPDGAPLVSGRKVTGSSNSEAAALGLTDAVPFLVEDMLKSNGGHYQSTGDWESHVVTDDLLITGQNPASSGEAARVLLDRLETG